MKTLKLFFLICLVTCFTSGIAYAQERKTVIEGTGTLIPYYLPCFDENVTGTVFYSTTIVNSHWQDKMWGTLTGSVTQNVYTLKQIQNDNWHPYFEGPNGVYAWTGTWAFFLDGKLVFLGHGITHVTRGTDGRYIVYFQKESEECK